MKDSGGARIMCMCGMYSTVKTHSLGLFSVVLCPGDAPVFSAGPQSHGQP